MAEYGIQHNRWGGVDGRLHMEIHSKGRTIQITIDDVNSDGEIHLIHGGALNVHQDAMNSVAIAIPRLPPDLEKSMIAKHEEYIKQGGAYPQSNFHLRGDT